MNDTPAGREDPTLAIRPTVRRRVSWGAIWAGMFVTVIMQVMFTLLGVACGIATLNPFSHPSSAPAGFSVGAMIWLMVSWLVSVWVEACVAGWMSGGPQRADGRVHGVVVWSFASAIILLLLTGAAGTLLSGSNGVVVFAPGNTSSMAAQGQPPGTPLSPTGRVGNQPPAQFPGNQPQGTASASGAGGGSPFWGEALWGFLALILGLAVAAWGGASGVASVERSPTPA